MSSFVGREADLTQLAELSSKHRLLTLVGPGGVGKSRLGLRLGTLLARAFVDGVWLIDVAPLTDPLLLPRAVADMLSIRVRPLVPWHQALGDHLRGRRLLLILDNCEHLIAGCSELATALLDVSPTLSVLATSREALGVQGEHVWRVPPLSVPTSTCSDLPSVKASDAVRLFVERASASLPDFELTARNAHLIAEICRRVDGLPLALELVAARAAGLGFAEIAARLDDGYVLRLGGRRGAPRRQQTLRATLDWSHALLDAAERTVFRRLAVFVSGWSPRAAAAVCSDLMLPADNVADVLNRLLAKSLVQSDGSSENLRYRFLEPVREYALLKLAASGEQSAISERHANYMLSLAELVPPDASDVAHAALLEREQDNLRAALGWALSQGKSELGLRLATAASTLWYFRGQYAEGSRWIEQMLLIDERSDSPVRVEALTWAGQLLHLQGKYASAEARLRPALEQHLVRHDARGIGLTMLMLGNVALWRGDLLRARALHDEAARRLRGLGNRAELVSVFQSAVAACELGQLNEAAELAARCEALGQDGKRPVAMAAAMHLRALIAARDRSAEAPLAELHDAIELERRLGDRQRLVESLTELGHVLFRLGQLAGAVKSFSEAASLAEDAGERICLVRALEGAARTLANAQPDATVQLAAATARFRAELGATAWPHDARALATALESARAKLTEYEFERARHAGQLLRESEAVSLLLQFEYPATVGSEPVHELTPSMTRREREVVQLLAQGASTRQIAEQLSISPDTVRTHLDHVMGKFDVHSRTQLVAWAHRNRYLHEIPRKDPHSTASRRVGRRATSL